MTGFMSKSHVGRYEIIDVIHYNQPRIVSTRMKLTQKVDHFTEKSTILSCPAQLELKSKKGHQYNIGC